MSLVDDSTTAQRGGNEVPADDWVVDLMRSFQQKLTAGLLRGAYTLEGEPLRQVMDAQAEACVHAFSELSDLPPDLDFESFLERMRTAGPSKMELTRLSPDELLWTELHEGQCVCPHVRLGTIALDRRLCRCGETWVRLLVERHARRPAAVSIVESVATGSRNCVYSIRLLPPALVS